MEETKDKDLYLRYLIHKKQRLEAKKQELESEYTKLIIQEETQKKKFSST